MILAVSQRYGNSLCQGDSKLNSRDVLKFLMASTDNKIGDLSTRLSAAAKVCCAMDKLGQEHSAYQSLSTFHGYYKRFVVTGK